MTRGPLHLTLEFWKLLASEPELGALAVFVSPGALVESGIAVWRTDSPPTAYAVAHGAIRFALWAAVHPIPIVPSNARSIAEIRTQEGEVYSHVLWYPAISAVVVPFDPNEAIESFERERYVSHKERTALPWAILSLYYAVLKPLLPPGVKLALRKLMRRRAYSKASFLDWPSDNSLDRLHRLLLGLMMMVLGRTEMQFVWFWPEGHEWAAVLTHDVETAAGLSAAAEVARLEKERGLASSFNLVPLDYDVSCREIQTLRDDEFELGVHGDTHDGTLFSSWGAFSRRVVRINQSGRKLGASGFRSPATYRNQDWFHLLEFEYDSSLADSAPFEPQPGGCGSYFPFACDGLVEIPITMPQDHTIFGLLSESSAITWVDKLHSIRATHGVACVLTHPDPAPGYVGLPSNTGHYVRLLDALVAMNPWIPLPRDLARWWRARASASAGALEELEGAGLGTAVLNDRGQIEVTGPGLRRPHVSTRLTRAVSSGEEIRVWIDMANSPHVQFFGPIIDEIVSRGHRVHITARDFAQTYQLLEAAGLEYTPIGHHGGKGSLGKIVAIEQRARLLARYARQNDVNVALHHNSYAQSLAATSMGIPSMTLMDYEHQPANHVSFRLSDITLVPECIPRRSVDRFGARWRLRRYPGLKEDFYVAGMVGEGTQELGIPGLDHALPLLVLRPPPDLAVYHRVENVLWGPMLDYLDAQPNIQVLVVPRTVAQTARLAGRRSDKVLVAEQAIPPGALLYHADGVITAGGTMAREAAALGVPAYTVFAGRQGEVDAGLVREGRLVEIASTEDFRRIRLAKCENRGIADMARQQQQVIRLVDMLVELASGRR